MRSPTAPLPSSPTALEEAGYTATRHQREVGAGYFDEVAKVVSGGPTATLAMSGSTEVAQFTG